ncbi:hypothetical protein ACIO3O_04545 [Streptomyces sp. NPDC087440]|uniref:hypothetical protein n=1 Tax=Streptomyces sp. NPDC087440 TaxID=3365790 RepID=UPI00382FF1C5
MGTWGTRGTRRGAVAVLLLAAALAGTGTGCTVDRSGYDGTRTPTERPELEDPNRYAVLELRAEGKGHMTGLRLRDAKIKEGVAPADAVPDEARCLGAWRTGGHEATVGAGGVDVFVRACSSVPPEGSDRVTPSGSPATEPQKSPATEPQGTPTRTP